MPISSRQRSTASALPLGAPVLEERLHDLGQLRLGRMSVGARPADHGLFELGREHVRELRPRLVPRDDDDPRPAEPAEDAVELPGDGLVVLEVQVLDVALVARLRPAALVMLARRLLGAVRDLRELAAPQREHASLLAADDGDDCAVAAADQRHERAEQEVIRDSSRVCDLPGKREHAPDVVRACSEDREAMRAVPVELLAEVATEPVEVGLQPRFGLVREIGPRGPV